MTQVQFQSATMRPATKVDSNGVLRGVSVLTSGIEAKGHGVYIDRKTLESVLIVAAKFGRVLVKVDHSSGVGASIGYLTDFRIDGDQLKADMHLLKSHPSFDFICELVSTQPSTVGLSIAFSQTTEEIGGKRYSRCEDLFSVDLVSSPAANPSGLFSVPPGPVSFGQAVGQLMMQRNISKGQAIELAVREHPDLHRAWLTSGDTSRIETHPNPKHATLGDLVAHQMRLGKSKAEAVSFCVQNYSDSYRTWLKGDTSKL